jgi:hypothetical protein
MNRVAALVLGLAVVPVGAQTPKAEQAPAGWSIATEGSGIPMGQNASEYAVELDREEFHGGQQAVSIRSVVSVPKKFRSITQFVKADAYRGKRVRLSGYLKARDVDDFAGIWMRIDGQTSMLAFDNMDRREVKGTTGWIRHEVVLDVPQVAMRIAFGALLSGAGHIWADDLALEIVDPSEAKSTRLIQFGVYRIDQASNLGFELTDPSGRIAVWDVHGHRSRAYSHRILQAGAHRGRAFLEARSTGKGTPLVFSAAQNVPAAPYRSKRLRFQAYLKTEGVTEEAFLSLEVGAKDSWIRVNSMGRGSKGKTDWQLQEIVLDVPANGETLGFAAELRGPGTLGVDDVSLEIVDPAKVALTPESDHDKAAREKHTRELAEAYPKLPERPTNLDFER